MAAMKWGDKVSFESMLLVALPSVSSSVDGALVVSSLEPTAREEALAHK